MIDKKICIVGGLGFVGRHLLETLSLSNQITVWDVKKRPSWLNQNVKYFDISSRKVNQLLDEDRFDILFYVAGSASIKKSIENPLNDLMENTFYLLTILECLKNINKTKIIYASSAACYGEMESSPHTKNDNPTSPYGISKLISEKYLKYYHLTYKIPVLICRIFSLYGEYNNKQVVYDTTKKLLNKNKSITIINPNSRRDFIYVKDAIEAILFLCRVNQYNGEIYDVGTGTETSILDLTIRLQKKLHVHSQFEKIDKNAPSDVHVQIANIHPLKKQGFTSRYTLDKGLTKTIKWIKEIQNE